MAHSRFTVVVPTRDRPDLLEFCLAGLAAQTLEDVEVIVSDNPTTAPARELFDRFAGPGWRYLRPPEPIAMHDNFELGCAAATGEHVAVVIDKTVLHPSALAVAAAALDRQPADIVTWRNQGYFPLDEASDVGSGRFQPAAPHEPAAVYDPARELARRLANAERRGLDEAHYVRGKIVFGAFSRALLDRIRERCGRLFHPLAPDYTSMVPACVLADRGLDVGRPLLVSYNSIRSNGRRQGTDPVHARRFIEAADPAIIEALPIAGLYTSMHNVVAYDLVSSAARLPAGSTPRLDEVQLVRRAREDLAGVAWTDPTEREAQYDLLRAAERRLGVVPEPAPGRTPRGLVRDAVRRVSALERLAERVAGGGAEAPTVFASPLDAARAAERYHAGRSAS